MRRQHELKSKYDAEEAKIETDKKRAFNASQLPFKKTNVGSSKSPFTKKQSVYVTNSAAFDYKVEQRKGNNSSVYRTPIQSKQVRSGYQRSQM